LAGRATVLLINAGLFYLAFVAASGKLLPTGGLESVWLLSAAALWFLTLLSSPWFLPPRDSLANAIGTLTILVTIDLAPAQLFHGELEVMRWLGVSYCAAIIALSLAALFLHDKDPRGRPAHLAYRLVGIFGLGEILYTIPAMISIAGAYQASFPAIASLTILWTFFVIARPVDRALQAWQQWQQECASSASDNLVGVIARIDHPNILRVRLSTGRKWEPGSLHVAAMAGGDQRYVVALFAQTQGAEIIGTGICVAPLQEPIVARAGDVMLSRETDRVKDFIENLSGTKDAELVGFLVENSTIAAIRFEIAQTAALEEGDVVFARVDGREVFYQILDAETTEESFDQNPRGTQIVRAAQLGLYDPDRGFTKYPWLPAMNTPLFAGKARAFPEPTLTERDFFVGKVPSTTVSVAASIDDIVEYHTAILGVTGTGKTELALDIVREGVKRGIKVFCVDFTGDYRQRLADLNPALPGPTKAEADGLEAALFAVDTGQYGAGAEKKALKAAIDKLRASIEAQIKEFLEGDGNLAILELTEITNTKASLRLTELYLSTIMGWAREHRRARQVQLVLEEAHTIIPETFSAGFDYDTQWVVGRIGQIALQGRKYGVGLLVVTQRTALVSKTILSQCNTFFTHSLIDQTSLNFLESVYSSQHTRLIPNLPNLHFLAFGKALRAERPILLRREFDPEKKAASDRLRRPLAERAS
jgi:hypothetical protein